MRRFFSAIAKAWRWLGDSSMDRRARQIRKAEEQRSLEQRGPDSAGRIPW
jgi:hypothetical protein